MDDKLLLEILMDSFKISKELEKAKEDSDFWYKSWKALQEAIEGKDEKADSGKAVEDDA